MKPDLEIHPLSLLNPFLSRYAMIGFGMCIAMILVATPFCAIQLSGTLNFKSLFLAHIHNPALIILDTLPFLFAYVSQSFYYELVLKISWLIRTETQKYTHQSGNLASALQFHALHDPLTQLPNLQHFSQKLHYAVSRLTPNQNLAVLVIGIQNFKDINSEIGAENADKILIHLAHKLKSLLTEPYLLETHMGINIVARLQGAQFAMLLPKLPSEYDLNAVLEKIIQSTHMPKNETEQNVEITTVAGATIYPAKTNHPSMIVDHALRCLQQAQNTHKPYLIFESHASAPLQKTDKPS